MSITMIGIPTTLKAMSNIAHYNEVLSRRKRNFFDNYEFSMKLVPVDNWLLKNSITENSITEVANDQIADAVNAVQAAQDSI